MNIGKITGIAESQQQRTYFTLASGAVIMGRKGVTAPKVGQWVIYNTQKQTKTRQMVDGELKLVPIPEKDQVEVNVLASVWDTKDEAIAAKNEAKLIALEEKVFLSNEAKKLMDGSGINIGDLVDESVFA